MKKRYLPIVAALLVAATPLRGEKPFCHAIKTSSPQWKKGTPAKSFAALAVNDLAIGVHLDASIRGEHSLELRLYTPKGHLYQSLEAPFGTATWKPGKRRRLPNFPQPLDVLPATASSLPGVGNTNVVTFVFPVGGTNIVEGSLYGDWRIEPYLDGSGTPCGKAETVTITAQ